MLLTQFIDLKVRDEIYLFLSCLDMIECCSIYGCQALNYYLTDCLKFKTYDIDILVYNSKNSHNFTEFIGQKLIKWLTTKLGSELMRFFPTSNFNLIKSSNHLNIKNTVKVFIGNKPLIDISECDEKDILYSKLYPDIITTQGYNIKSFEWLIMNLIEILKNRTVLNNHIWEKCKDRATRILFILNHRPYTNLLHYRISAPFLNNILYLKKIINFTDNLYYSGYLYENQLMKYSDLEEQYNQYKRTHFCKIDKLHFTIQKYKQRCVLINTEIFQRKEQYGELQQTLDLLKLELQQSKANYDQKYKYTERIKTKMVSIERNNRMLSGINVKLISDIQKYKFKYNKIKVKYSSQNFEMLMKQLEDSYSNFIQTNFKEVYTTISKLDTKLIKLTSKLAYVSNCISKSNKDTKLVTQKEHELLRQSKEISKLKSCEQTTKLFCKKKIVECSRLSIHVDEIKEHIIKYSTEFSNFLEQLQITDSKLNEQIMSRVQEYKKQLDIILQ